MRSIISLTAVAAVSMGMLGSPVLAAEEHGHCSGANVCGGDANCEKQGYKDMTKDQCSKIDGAKFEASGHGGEDHKDEKHGHDKK
ncbi:hypothetical protein [Hyphomicrobium sp.]|uniref:hypothetical protein n=1 Tax=Hyphomicrobium sp. TaxID=82 RepID=UPI001D48A2B8|nr:hypothetical protein [Hyphomicrobium sp.]MBY0558504.1 hypothetical protein [Hyphomicrobium sp.]